MGLEIWQAAVLGIVEGITEYLPVSSTGHLIIASDLMGLPEDGTPLGKAIDTFNIVVQGGAILAVLGLYWPRFVQMLKGLMGQDNAGFRLLINLAIAFTPAAVIGLIFRKVIKAHLFNAPTVIAAFIVGGVFMILIDRLVIAPRRNGTEQTGKAIEQLTPIGALNIGLMQIFAMIPGTSRSMMTISGGVLTGLRPAAAAEFSFLLGMPTLVAASALELYKNLKEAKEAGEQNFIQVLGVVPILVGMVVAAVCAALAVKWLVSFLNKQGLAPFGVYRIIIGIVLGLLIWRGVVDIKPPSKDEKPKTPAAVQTTPSASTNGWTVHTGTR
jgi:undecaprenyl-diphosphatase